MAKFRIMHVVNHGKLTRDFSKEVKSVQQAIEFLDLIAEYDLALGDEYILNNSQFLEKFNEEHQEWEDYIDTFGNDFEEIREMWSKGTYPCQPGVKTNDVY